MLAFVAIIIIVGFVQMRTEKPQMGHLPAPSRPLFKPEPGSLLTQSGLSLTAEQRSAIQSIESSWQVNRTRLLTAMSAYQPKQGRADQISAGLQDYSELSRSFDTTRASYWTQACAQLNPKQKELVEGASK